MRFDGIIRVTELFPGISRVDHEIGLAELLQLVGQLAPVPANPAPPNRLNGSGVVNFYGADGAEIIVRLAAVTEENFKAFYDSLADKSGLAAVLRGQRTDTLLSFLKDRGVTSLSTYSKDQMVDLIVANPKTLFKALGGIARGWTYDTRGAKSVGSDPKSRVYYHERPVGSLRAKRLDFWQVSWDRDRESGTVEFTTKSEATALAGIPADARIRLSWRVAKLPEVEFAGATADLDSLKIRDIAEEHGVKASTTRDETIKRVIAKYDDPKKAAAIDGKRLFISFDAPLLIGRPLTTDELFTYANYIKFQGSAERVYEAVIDAKGGRTDFQHYFRAKPKCWAVFADVSVE